LFLVHRFLSPWWRRRQVPPKRRFLQEPHGVTSQKTPFFSFPLILYNRVVKIRPENKITVKYLPQVMCYVHCSWMVWQYQCLCWLSRHGLLALFIQKIFSYVLLVFVVASKYNGRLFLPACIILEVIIITFFISFQPSPLPTPFTLPFFLFMFLLLPTESGIANLLQCSDVFQLILLSILEQ
jgi:hypothetical protein